MLTYELDRTLLYIFLLTALLIAVVWYVGLSTDSATFFSGTKGLVQTLTGQNAQGQFGSYPGGAQAAAAH